MIGNVAFILFSGGYDYADTMPHFEAGCWLKRQPDVAFIAGHWNDYELGALGCKKKMAVPGVYSEIRGFDGYGNSMPRCSSVHHGTHALQQGHGNGLPVGQHRAWHDGCRAGDGGLR